MSLMPSFYRYLKRFCSPTGHPPETKLEILNRSIPFHSLLLRIFGTKPTSNSAKNALTRPGGATPLSGNIRLILNLSGSTVYWLQIDSQGINIFNLRPGFQELMTRASCWHNDWCRS